MDGSQMPKAVNRAGNPIEIESALNVRVRKDGKLFRLGVREFFPKGVTRSPAPKARNFTHPAPGAQPITRP